MSDSTNPATHPQLTEAEAARASAAALLAGIEDSNEYWRTRAKAALAAVPWMPLEAVAELVREARAAGAGFAGKSDEEAVAQLRQRPEVEPFPLPRDAVLAWCGRTARVQFGDQSQSIMPVWAYLEGRIDLADGQHITVTPLPKFGAPSGAYSSGGRVPLAFIKGVDPL